MSLGISLRGIVGGVFLLAGASKLPMLSELADFAVAYEILPMALARLYAVVLPWLEIVIGVCLIAGIRVRLFALVSIPITVSFIIANARAIAYDAAGGCPCFGKLITVSHNVSLGIDAALLAGTLGIFLIREHHLTLESRLVKLFRPKR
ncbi:MauE/DoxX family redox-associated membrane protein [Chloroflexota bacterium]